jgi:hypothetical protein
MVMKKIVCSLVILALAAPVLAAHDPCNFIEITLADGGQGVLEIYAKVGADSSDTPVGIALTCLLSDPAKTLDPCGVLAYDPCFPVFMDYAHDAVGGAGFDPCSWNPSDPCYAFEPPYGPMGTPIADPCGPGLPDPCVAEFALCMGRLDPCEADLAVPKGVVKLLAKVQLYKNVYVVDGCDAVNVTVTENSQRGGAVGVNDFFDVFVIGSPVAIDMCKDSCWDNSECPGRANGDGDCNGFINIGDLNIWKDGFDTDATDPHGTAYQEYNCCADFDRNTYINIGDLNIWKAGFAAGTTYPGSTNKTNCPPAP